MIALAAGAADGGVVGLARRLADHGQVVLLAPGPPPSGIPDGVGVVSTDLRTSAGAEEALRHAESGWGPVTCLVTAPSPAPGAPVASIEDALWGSTLEANLSVAVNAARAAARGMSRRRSGRIAVVTWRLDRAARLAHLAAAAGALSQFARALAPELGPSGITVNAVAVPPADLPAAGDAVALLLSSDAGYLTAEVLVPGALGARP